MTTLLVGALTMSVVLAAALAATAALRRRSAALRHWVLALGCLLAAITPLAAPLLPSWPLPAWLPAVSTPAATEAAETTGRILTLSSSAVDMTPSSGATQPRLSSRLRDRVIVGLWLAGAALGLGRIAAGGLRLRALARRAGPPRRAAWTQLGHRIAADYGLRRPVAILQSAHPSLLVTWGLRRPTILLPAAARSWSDERIAIVLRHELAHVRRADWIVLLATTLLRAICWFNPLVWLACRRLRQESEHACDDMVLRHGVAGADYATHLIDIARLVCRTRRGWVPAPAIAHPSTLEQRIRAMLNAQYDRTPPSLLIRAAAALSFSLAALTVAAVSAATAPAAAPEVAAFLPARSAAATTMPAAMPAPPVAAQSAATPPAPPAVAGAQTAGLGSVAGTVFDQIGGLVPGTDITLTSEARGGALVTVADSRGTFEFRDVRPGQYTLEARLPGFRNLRTTVQVTANAAHTRRLAMQVGSLQETITVIGSRNPPPATEPSARTQPAPAADAGRANQETTRQAELAAVAARLEAVAEQTRAARAAGFRPGTVGGTIKAPAKVFHKNPIYPAGLQSAGIEGQVMLVARIGIDGFVVDALPSREADANPPVHPDLVAAAIAAVREWKFTPTLLNGVPVEVEMAVSVQFSMR